MPAPAQTTPRAKMATRAAFTAAITLAMLASMIPMASASAAAADHLTVTPSAGSVLSAGSINVTVTAKDSGGATDTGYTGTVHFTSTDGGATLPADYTFTGPDAGVHVFSVTLVKAGSQTVTATDTGTSSITGTSSVVTVQMQLAFTVEPGGGAGGSVWGTQPTVELRDKNNAAMTNGNGGNALVSVSITSNPGGGTLAGCAPVAGAAGVATFSACKIDKAGAGYRLTATAANSIAAVSATFDITVGPAAGLKFGTYPGTQSSTTLGSITVSVVDAGGNTIAGDTRAVTLVSNQNDGTFTCTNKTVNAVNGTATFTNCSQSVIANGYQITASAAGVTNAVGAVFNVTSGAPTKLAFCWGSVAASCSTTPPTSPVGGGLWTPQPTIIVQDAAGNKVSSLSAGTVAIAITSGTPLSGGPGTLTCSSGTSVAIIAGVATFSGCTIDKAGASYKLTATSNPAYTSATSLPFTVVAGTPTKLVFTSQPTTGAAGQAFPIQPVVAITDAGGNVSSTTTATITLSLTTNPGGGTLTCTNGLSVNTTLGVATFSGCAISAAGTGYVITATATNVSPTVTLATASTNPFTLTAQQAQLSLTSTSSVITWGAGVTLTTHFLVAGNNRTFSLQASTDNITWSTIANLTTDSTGYASLFYRPARNLWYRASWAGSGDLTAATSPTVRVVVRQIAILRPTNGGVTKTIAVGTTTAFTTTVRPARPELPKAKVEFRVYKKTGGIWVIVKTAFVFIDSAGIAKFSYKFGSSGQYYVRSYTWPTTANANSEWSQLERFSVQ